MKKYYLALLLAMLTITLPLASMAEEEHKEPAKKESKQPPGPRQIDSEEIKRAIESNIKFTLVDTRPAKDFAVSHIRDAKSLPFEELDEEALNKAAPDKKTSIVFYCEDEECTSAMAAAVKAMELGYEKVYKYQSGLKDWRNKGFPMAD